MVGAQVGPPVGHDESRADPTRLVRVVNQTGRLEATTFATVLGREDGVDAQQRPVETETVGTPFRILCGVTVRRRATNVVVEPSLGVAPNRHNEQHAKRCNRSFGLDRPLLYLDIVLSTEESSSSRSC